MMADKCNEGFKEAVCIHTDKVYDSCRDKDCIENLRVYLTPSGQEVIDCAINVKCTKAEIIWCEPFKVQYLFPCPEYF